jgi:predicted nucleotidyltransferase
VSQPRQNQHPVPDPQRQEAALRRSGLCARELARITNTGLVVTIDGALPTMRTASTLQAANLPPALRSELLPALELLVERHHPEGLWLFGSWARGSASRRSDVDLLVMGLSDKRLLDAYDAVLEALQDCRLPFQPLVGLARPCWPNTAILPSGAR